MKIYINIQIYKYTDGEREKKERETDFLFSFADFILFFFVEWLFYMPEVSLKNSFGTFKRLDGWGA